MDRCPRCGAPADQDDLYCGSCGFKLEWLEGEPAATQMELKASDIHYKLGEVYFKVGKYDLAIETFEKILEVDPHNAQVIEMCEKAREIQRKTAVK